MMMKGTRRNRADTINRRTHQDDVANNAAIVAKKIGLSEKFTAIVGRHHDKGHTFMGHSGEWWISNVLEDYGLGCVCHNALGPKELIYRNDIYNEIIQKIKLFNPHVTNKELEKVKSSLWIIMDGINAHNGEIAKQQFIPKVRKSQKDFIKELTNCFTTPGFDKTIEPAATETCLMRLIDQITYIPYDMADGLREKFISGLNNEYIEILEQLGISQTKVNEYLAKGDYDGLAKRIQNIFLKDLEENSTKRKIAMSDEVFTLMKKMKKVNDNQIVDYVLPDIDLEIYPQGVKQLINIYKDKILQSNLVNRIANEEMDVNMIYGFMKKYEGTPYIGLIEYSANTPIEDYKYTEQISKDARIKGIKKEQEIARECVLQEQDYEPKNGFNKKNNRIKGYISYYKEKLKGNKEYEQEEIEEDIGSIVSNINKGKFNENYVSNQEAVAILMGANYLATLSDREFMQQLLEFGVIDKNEESILTVKYKDVDLKNRKVKDEAWETVKSSYEEEK